MNLQTVWNASKIFWIYAIILEVSRVKSLTENFGTNGNFDAVKQKADKAMEYIKQVRDATVPALSEQLPTLGNIWDIRYNEVGGFPRQCCDKGFGHFFSPVTEFSLYADGGLLRLTYGREVVAVLNDEMITYKKDDPGLGFMLFMNAVFGQVQIPDSGQLAKTDFTEYVQIAIASEK